MAFEEIAELKIFAEHVEAIMAAEALELGRVFAVIHAGREGAALEAVAAKIATAEPGLLGAGFDDFGDGPGRDRLRANLGQGRGNSGRGRPERRLSAGLPFTPFAVLPTAQRERFLY
jgi:hypothetical protein